MAALAEISHLFRANVDVAVDDIHPALHLVVFLENFHRELDFGLVLVHICQQPHVLGQRHGNIGFGSCRAASGASGNIKHRGLGGAAGDSESPSGLNA